MPQTAHLYKRIAIPDAFLNQTAGRSWGGDIRIGDLTGKRYRRFFGIQVARRHPSLFPRSVYHRR